MKSYNRFNLFGLIAAAVGLSERNSPDYARVDESPSYVPKEPAIDPVKEIEPPKQTFMGYLLGKQAFWHDQGRDERIAKAQEKRRRKLHRNLELVRLGGLKAVA